MRPIKLKISGLNSYIETQTIEFDRLTERGLFGIFGPTGCGKSTILDAIILSLYGHKGQKGIPRSTNEFINTATDQASISYLFGLDTDEGPRKIQVERKFKRTTTGIATSFSRLQVMDEDNEPLEVWDKTTDVSNQVVELLGLTREDFMRSVVLPQGKFSEFLTLEGKERRDMLERLLNLKAYGSALQFKIKRRGDHVKDKMLQMEGEMKRYADVSPEALDHVKAELKAVQSQEEDLNKRFLAVEAEKTEGDHLYKLIKSLKDQTLELKKLEDRGQDMDAEKLLLRNAEKALNIWPYFTQFQETQKTLENIKSQLVVLDKAFQSASNLYLSKKEERTDFLKSFDKDKEALVVKTSSIEKAREHKIQAEDLSKTRQELLQSYKTLKSKYAEEVDQLALKEKLIDETESKLAELEKQRSQYKIDTEEREAILKGLKQEESHKKLSAQNELLKVEFDKKSDQLKQEKIQLKRLNESLQAIQADLTQVNEMLELKQKKAQTLPLEVSKLEKERVQKQADRTSLADKIKVKNEYLNKKKQLESKMSGLKEKSKVLTKALQDAQKDMDKAQADRMAYWTEQVLSHLSDNLETDEACPLCGSNTHPHIHVKKDIQNIENLGELETAYRESSIAFEQNENEKRHIDDQFAEVNSKLEDLTAVTESHLLQMDKELRTIDDKVKTLNTELLTVESHVKKATQDKSEMTLKADKLGLQISEKQTIITKLETQIESTKDQVLKIDAELLDLESILLVKENGYIYEKKYEDLKKKDSKLAEIEQDIDKQRQAVKSTQERLLVLRKSSHEKQVEMEKIVEKGSGLKDRIESHLSEVNKVATVDSLEDVYIQTKDQLDNLLAKNETSKNELESAEKIYRELDSQFESLKAKNNMAIGSFDQASIKLNEAIDVSGFGSLDRLKESYMDSESLSKRQRSLKAYEESVNILKDRIKELEKEKGSRDLSHQAYQDVLEKHKTLKLDLDKVKESRAKLSEKLKALEKDMKTLEATLLRYKKYQHAQDLVKDLLDLVKGNKFVEYVAVTHLRYIALDASKRLMDITNHRYSLELDAKGNFIICDHYNGGVKRDTKTLSGGETFLTALSLSLALSSQIQLKGRTNLEFFFLDEGFGTLDSELLDIVMTSLEKLFHEKLTVGIISHVDELKNRVPIKLTVEPAQAGVHGTKTKLEVT